MPANQNRNWTYDDAFALREDADACPGEIGGSSFLAMLLRTEGLQIHGLDEVAVPPHAA